MKIDPLKITVRDLVQDYSDDGDGGVRGYGGLLDIRPPYQREFVYGEKQRASVIESINSRFPINTMYWSKRKDGTYEVIDGQQRTISIAQYVSGSFSIDGLAFHNLQEDQKTRIMNYELMVYACSGTDSEKLKWYETINIAGMVLTTQELRNAVYAGIWLSDAKRHFSRPGGPAFKIGKDYLSGSPIRQKYLETAIKWISNDRIEDYMSKHQHDPTAGELWRYFQSVISWVESTFTKKRKKFMQKVDWGSLYNKHNATILDPAVIEEETARLIIDDDVTSKSGIYPYILTRNEKHLNIRAFTDAMKQKVYEKQNGICASCNDRFKLPDMEADHVTPWSEGGKTSEENCKMLCKECNRRKSSK